MPKDWNAFWYWRDRPVQERVNAANVLKAAGVKIVELVSRNEREQPPDCEAKLDGQFSGIEVTELLHQTDGGAFYQSDKGTRGWQRAQATRGVLRLGSRQPSIGIAGSY